MILYDIQKHIEQIYRINTGVNVEDYLIDQKTRDHILKTHQKISTQVHHSELKGLLLLTEAKEELNIAVYFDKKVLKALSSSPFSINKNNISEFFTAAEEISHFVYTVWNAHNERQISRLEMELQGEVDKFISTLFFNQGKEQKIDHNKLHEKLFYNINFHETLSKEEISRYELANKAAFEYCFFLGRSYLKQYDLSGLVRDLRIFYRKNHTRKFDHIRQAVN